MTRLLREHPAVDAELDDAGRLVAIRWAGRREPVEVCTRWRVEDAWWGRPIARDSAVTFADGLATRTPYDQVSMVTRSGP